MLAMVSWIISWVLSNLTLQLSGLVGASTAIGRRGSMSKVGFQLVSYGLNQMIPRSGATNDDCLLRIMEKWNTRSSCCQEYLCLVLFVSSKPSTWKTIEKLSPSCKKNQKWELTIHDNTSIKMGELSPVLVRSYSVTISSNEVSTQALLWRILVVWYKDMHLFSNFDNKNILG